MHETILLDGGMGQELVRRAKKTDSPLWSAAVLAEQPDIVEAVHLEYLQAGADVITVNSYSVTPARLQREGQAEAFEPLQQKAIEVALKARDKSGAAAKIAGCLPPLVGSYKAEHAMNFDRSLHDYRTIVEQQQDHVDLFICETMASIEEAKAAATAGMESGKPVWLAWTVADDTDHPVIRSGDDLSDALSALDSTGIDATLLNCSKPESISNAWPTLATATGPIGAYANGFTSVEALQPGGTVNALESRRDLDPGAYADFVEQWIQNGASIVGGCCEVGPAHIAEIARRIK